MVTQWEVVWVGVWAKVLDWRLGWEALEQERAGEHCTAYCVKGSMRQ